MFCNHCYPFSNCGQIILNYSFLHSMMKYNISIFVLYFGFVLSLALVVQIYIKNNYPISSRLFNRTMFQRLQIIRPLCHKIFVLIFTTLSFLYLKQFAKQIHFIKFLTSALFPASMMQIYHLSISKL